MYARERAKEREGERGVGDPRVCESMPGFNDQQRGRGCILTAVEKRKERSVEEGEEERRRRRGRRLRWRWKKKKKSETGK